MLLTLLLLLLLLPRPRRLLLPPLLLLLLRLRLLLRLLLLPLSFGRSRHRPLVVVTRNRWSHDGVVAERNSTLFIGWKMFAASVLMSDGRAYVLKIGAGLGVATQYTSCVGSNAS